jgi:hypothetical protein
MTTEANFLPIKCPHCGTINKETVNYCTACSLEIGSPPTIRQDSAPTTRTAIIITAIVIGGAILLWLLACMCASGLSDK